MTANNADEFRQMANDNGVEDIYEDGSQELRIYEDDGHFFINQYGVRAAWYIGQESTRIQFNRQANLIIRNMGYDHNYNGRGIV